MKNRNARDYLMFRGDLAFSVAPLTEVDLYLFSQLVTPDYSEILRSPEDRMPLHELSEAYFRTHTEDPGELGVMQSKEILLALKEEAASARFGNLIIGGYEKIHRPEEEEQFSALTIELPDGSICISYRGTDDTIIGWKEDFMIAVHTAVAAQKDAAAYAKRAMTLHPDVPVYLCGHSKGGNLAVYASVCGGAAVRQHLCRCVSFDGPGFLEKFLKKPEYKEVQDRIVTMVSQNTLVGGLLHLAGQRVMVHTDYSVARCHNGFHWEVRGTQFLRNDRQGAFSRDFAEIIADVLSEMDEKQREDFVDQLFGVLLSTGAVTLTDLANTGVMQKAALAVRLGTNKKVTDFLKRIVKSIQEDQLPIAFSLPLPEPKKKEKPKPVRKTKEKPKSVRKMKGKTE